MTPLHPTMRRLASIAITLLLVASAVGGVAPVAAAQDGTTTPGTCSFPVTSTDATGTKVTVENRPSRVVTLAPSAAQTMWEIGGKSQVVGVSQFASYLDGASNRTVVTSGSPSAVSVEKVVGLNPGLVLAPNTIENRTVRKLRDAGLTVYRLEAATSIEDVYRKTRLIGRLTGNCEGAAETVASMREQITAVREAVSDRQRPTVFYAMGGGYTAGTGTFIHEILSTAGANNVAAAANISSYGQISDEVLIQRNPRYIVVSSENASSVENPKSLVPDSAAIRSTTAYKRGNIIVVNTDYLSQPAPRIVRPITTIARALHPEAFPSHGGNATATGTATTGTDAAGETAATTTTAGGSTTAATATPGETETNTPGFGVTAALVAVLATALLARRR